MLTRKTPLRRSKIASSAGARNVGLARNTGVNPKRETPRRSSRVLNEQYLDTCRSKVTPTVRCMIKRELGATVDACIGPVCPDHQRDMTGGSMRASDALSYPACLGHHEQMERFAIANADTREARKAMRDYFIELHHADLERDGWRFHDDIAVPPTASVSND